MRPFADPGAEPAVDQADAGHGQGQGHHLGGQHVDLVHIVARDGGVDQLLDEQRREGADDRRGDDGQEVEAEHDPVGPDEGPDAAQRGAVDLGLTELVGVDAAGSEVVQRRFSFEGNGEIM